MDDVSARLRALGDRVSDASDRLTDPGELAAARRLWLEAPAATSPRSRRALAFAAAAAACLATLLVVASLARPRAGVAFVVGAPPVPGDVGSFIAASAASPVPIAFSEGTHFTLSPGATVRVTETTAHGASLLLEKGSIDAEVVHRSADTRWNLAAGPFEVRVVGTKFDASWDPAGQTFELTMREGVVVVRGPLLSDGREVHAGEHLRISVGDSSLELRGTDAAPPPPRAPLVGSAATAAPCPAPSAAQPAEDKRATREGAVGSGDAPKAAAPVTIGEPPNPAAQPAESTWRELAAAGKYGEALAAAERAGFPQLLERASSSDLAVLGDAARYAGRPALAKQVVLAQRRRFGARGTTAFLLGKIAADQQGASGEAARWFETYLQEEPNGALAEQAYGRLLQMRKGNPAQARGLAERYLARYPNGANAALARSLVSP